MGAKVKNFDELALSDSRKLALTLVEAGLAAINTEAAIKSAVRIEGGTLHVKDEAFPLTAIDRLFVVGVGKCSNEAAAALESVLGDRIHDGIIVDVRCDKPLKKIRPCKGDHPFPTEGNINFTKDLIAMLGGMTERDVVLMIISGGGSTLLCQPKTHTCEQESDMLHYLFESGATIQEINTVRKHLSLARGGFLAKYAYPAQVATLIFSDVPGDPLGYVASGPTIKDTSRVSDAAHVLHKYEIWKRSDFSMGGLIETPKEDKYFEKVRNILLVSNSTALAAMAAAAQAAGLFSNILTSVLQGEAKDVGRHIVQDLHEAAPRTARLYGGQTTVTLTGMGRGGRNQELALSALRFVEEGEVIVSFASDGQDNSKAAGAICDTITMGKAKKLPLDPETYLAGHDSHTFFSQTKDLIITGYTGANVSDLIIAIKYT